MQRLKLGGFKVAESRKGTQNVYKVETNILNRLFLSVRGTTIEPSNEKPFFWDSPCTLQEEHIVVHWFSPE